jgi:Zn-dependent M28 family amino/carboxypeptidase
MTLKLKFTLLIILLCLNSVFGQKNDKSEITISELKKDIFFLASDSLKGRYPGTEGDRLAAIYIAARLKDSGVELFNKNGFQEFKLVTGVHLGDTNTLSWKAYKGKVNDDFLPQAYSGSKRVIAPVVFAGYGFDINENSITWNDYANLDVKGKWVLILRGEPLSDSSKSIYRNYSNDRNKTLIAKDKGAAGVILVSGSNFDKNDDFAGLHNFEGSVEIPVIQLKRSATDSLLSLNNSNIHSLEQKLNKELKPFSFEIKRDINASISVKQTIVTTRNVIGFIPSENSHPSDQYIVIGAHFDHLGLGGPGSSSRKPDTLAIHNGADDNASGVAAVLELAGKLSAHKNQLKKGIIFVLFSGEEEGILGSGYFTEHPPVALKSIKTYLNLDMVGRLKPDSSLEIGGTGTSVGAVQLLNKILPGNNLKLSFSPEGYGPSDHASFYAKDIPVFFFTTGVHLDYHTPSDDADRINYPGLRQVDEYIYKLAYTLATSDSTLRFTEAGPKVSTSTGRKYKITLGIMPDFSSTDNKGLKAELVLKDKPAEKGGMKNGDIIVGINGGAVTNIQDYMFRLNQLKAGDIVKVNVNRNGKIVELIINL